jgi:hypothetical protein
MDLGSGIPDPGVKKEPDHGSGSATLVTVAHGQNVEKTPNPKCRLYWCLIEFIVLRYSQSCWYFFDPSCELAPLKNLSWIRIQGSKKHWIPD